MTTIGLEAQKVLLMREIINSDNKEFLQKMIEACKEIQKQLAETVIRKKDAEPESKEAVMDELKCAILDLNDYKAGRIQARPAEALLEELLAEEV